MLGNKAFNQKNHLEIAGCDIVQLAEEFGTPLYVYDEALLRSNIKDYQKRLKELHPDSTIAYAGKAFLCSAMCRLLDQESMWLDVVSGGEYYVARESGFPTERLLFHGNNKSPQERELVLKNGIGRWVIDSEWELALLSKEAKNYLHGKLPVFFRITPGIDPHTHAYITTGKVDSKFGLTLVDGIAQRVIRQALSYENLDVKGLHCHIGSQIDSLEPFINTIKAMVRFMDSFKEQNNFVFSELDLGGGLGVPYLEEQKGKFPSVQEYVEAIAKTLQEECEKYQYPLPKLFIEPGRSIVNNAGNTVYTVGTIKEIPGIKKYIAVDGGMTDNPRPILYDARYQAIIANRVNQGSPEMVSVVGKCCESGDVVIQQTETISVQNGDILVVEGTGAYNYSMASNYNLIPRPGVVFIRDEKPYLVVRHEGWYDLVRRDILPEYLIEKGE
ncbi:diaminopimelate decarboxylase [Atribacter laminatus]|uniref:Diaminopimelate decarboxylase n=1 Tax=Atribacter laminatus TaxID=2847778 RepID=A0A7T1ALS1_ATRLM|nr:diaminopimelate decarboxylase [Atribacter laminatus]QPM68263.1 Diaminopimelate decarboxylase [Atribacter laminatus]